MASRYWHIVVIDGLDREEFSLSESVPSDSICSLLHVLTARSLSAGEIVDAFKAGDPQRSTLLAVSGDATCLRCGQGDPHAYAMLEETPSISQ